MHKIRKPRSRTTQAPLLPLWPSGTSIRVSVCFGWRGEAALCGKGGDSLGKNNVPNVGGELLGGKPPRLRIDAGVTIARNALIDENLAGPQGKKVRENESAPSLREPGRPA